MAQTKTAAQESAKESTQAAVYTKDQLAASKKYANRRDLIRALLEDGKTYTLDEVDSLINTFMKGKVS